jgi:NTP pyrophosphatase (non-canonical NTP hydrolase)
MNMKQYQAEAAATKSNVFYYPHCGDTVAVIRKPDLLPVDILHAVMGVSTEAGELLDVAKKAMFYGKDVDLINLDEEIGDVLWYIAIYCNARGTTIEELAHMNNQKLKVRFPDKFSTFHANNRDLEAERKSLETNTKFPDGMQPPFSLIDD